MKTFKRIPIPDHECIFICKFEDVQFVIKRCHSKITGTVSYIILETGVWTLYLIEQYIPDLWYTFYQEDANAIEILKEFGFTEVDPTESEFKIYQGKS